ncbi:MAG TPA: [FeFe] hydrogenase H-cluster maturation GTPase HydF [Salinivirgaceae bacterium]|nr:[FeFe] hydrogenase H-cluster maturation GTPase HydF [Salinivirgaceae bacterium]HQA76217.1 [FeFe] hydrogenase H-cluster maturation GTPase HydF [Salinivirgaceae bacterium]
MTNKESTRDLKPHIGIFGRRNVGKSTLINMLTGQEVAIVSDIPGTTTDPVKRSVEILDFSPVVIIDTAGIDDVGKLGEKRIQRTRQVLSQIDLAFLLVTDNQFGEIEDNLIKDFDQHKLPYILVYSKTDISTPDNRLIQSVQDKYNKNIFLINTVNPEGLKAIIEEIKRLTPETAYTISSILGDIVRKDDIVLLIVSIDAEAPAGRLILPQVQVLRDMLDNHAVSIVLQFNEVARFLKTTGIKPKLVITDSQLFYRKDELVPDDIMLTGFSIVLARHKGNFQEYMKGTPKIDSLKDGDRVLILESCSHHVSCDDIGRVKIPRWMIEYTKKQLEFDVVAGLSKINRPITDYALVVQCGGCMITRKQLHQRLQVAIDAGVPITNYGMAIAFMHGYYYRVIEPFL